MWRWHQVAVKDDLVWHHQPFTAWQLREVHTNHMNPLFVKSINIFPLPGEWECMVRFVGTCADVVQLLFSPFQGALPYYTCMIPAANNSMIIPVSDLHQDWSCSGELQEHVPVWCQGTLPTLQCLTQLLVQMLMDCPYCGMIVCLLWLSEIHSLLSIFFSLWTLPFHKHSFS